MQKNGKAFFCSLGQRSVNIHFLSHSIYSCGRQKNGDDKGTKIHRCLLFRLDRIYAQRRPAETESIEASHTAGRMSKGVEHPAAARSDATVAGSN